MSFITKNTAENMFVILANILLFQGMLRTKYIGDFMVKYPMAVIFTALAVIVFADKMAKGIKFIEHTKARGFIYLVGGVLLFNGMVNIPSINLFLSAYSVYAIGIAILLFITKDKLADMIGG